MKLALVTQDFPPVLGGIETYSWELARRFAASLESLVVLAPGHPEAAAVDVKAGFQVLRCGSKSDALPATMAPMLAKLVARGEVDTAFHSQWQTLPASVALRKTGRLRGLFAAAHGRELLLQPLHHSRLLQRGYDGFRRGVLRSTDLLFPVSRFTGGLLEQHGVAPTRYRVVSNGTDPEHFRPRCAEGLRLELGIGKRPVLLCVGRLVPNKGVDTVIDAIPKLLAKVPELVFVVVGEGPDRARVEQLARERGVEGHCRFVGRVPFDALPDYYSMADVFVTLSRQVPPAVEGFGLVFLEASACGTAVIGARSGGIPDAIVEGQTGYLVPPDDPGAFAEVAARLLAHPAHCQRMGEAGRQHVLTRGNWDATHAALLEAMGSVVGR